MATRIDLHQKLVSLVGPDVKVYFQPPENIRMSYPAIVYNFTDVDTEHADNIPYIVRKQYSVTLISTNPDNPLVDTFIQLPLCSFDRRFVSDELYHDVFTLYY